MNTTSQTTHGREETLSSYIAVRRKAMGLSLRQLATRTGVRPSYVCRIGQVSELRSHPQRGGAK